MRDSTEKLFEIVYRYYRRDVWPDDPHYSDSDEHHRLIDACHHAYANYETWRALLGRLSTRFPDVTVHDNALHLASGGPAPSYGARLMLPTIHHNVGAHALVFLVSAVAPYYVIYSNRFFYIEDHPNLRKDTPPDLFRHRSSSHLIRFDLLSEEASYARGLAQEIEATFVDYELMRQEIGKVVVPGVSTSLRPIGEATIYDCLFSDDWFRPEEYQ